MKEKSKTLKKRKPIVTLSIALLVSSLMLLTACVDSGSTMDNVESSETSQPKSETAKPDTPAQIEWSDSMECSLCHTTQTDSMTDAACQISLNHSGLSCVTCHSEGLSAAHIGITAETKMPRRLKSTEVSSETCLSCHEANYSIEATADKLLTDSVGASVNPHDLP